MKHNGFDYRTSEDRHYNVLVVCESFWSLVAAIEKGAALSPAALRTGFGGLGKRDSTINFAAAWSPTRLASAAVVADLGYDLACACFRYTGARTPL